MTQVALSNPLLGSDLSSLQTMNLPPYCQQTWLSQSTDRKVTSCIRIIIFSIIENKCLVASGGIDSSVHIWWAGTIPSYHGSSMTSSASPWVSSCLLLCKVELTNGDNLVVSYFNTIQASFVVFVMILCQRALCVLHETIIRPYQ